MKFNFSSPFNTLSFGFVGYNLAKEFLLTGENEVAVYPTGRQTDLSAYSKASPEFRAAFQQSVERGLKVIDRDAPEVKLWHIDGSENRLSNKSGLVTFYELDSPTEQELAILRSHERVFVTSKYTLDILTSFGLTNVSYVPLGFDKENFFDTKKSYYPPEVTVFGIFGKFEHRKRHAKAVKAWLSKFGKRRDVVLHTHLSNPHLSPEHHKGIYTELFGMEKPFNVNILPFMKTLGELNEAFNAVNIVLDMSGAEGFSLPSFHCLGLGKHGVIHNATAMKDWANEKNSVLVNPARKIDSSDGFFFAKGRPFNQGNIFDWNEDEFIAACETALAKSRTNRLNQEGLKLQDEFTWSRTSNTILENLS